jgi:hypothetical protein
LLQYNVLQYNVLQGNAPLLNVVWDNVLLLK